MQKMVAGKRVGEKLVSAIIPRQPLMVDCGLTLIAGGNPFREELFNS
jgi:hypothetical protein